MNICIRADGGSIIGMGHVMRTLVLAEELRKHHNVFYVCKVDNPLTSQYSSGIKLIKDKNFKVVEVIESEISKEIVNINADCIITDSYDVNQEYFNILRMKFPLSGCIYDTDYNEIDKFNVDFFINPDLYALSKPVNTENCNLKLLGVKYVILRKEFLNFVVNNKYSLSSNIRDIIITLGGGNSSEYIYRILENIKDLHQFNFHVVLGAGFNDKDSLINKYSKCRNIHIKYNISNMCNLMAKCDLAVSACGTTLYELMYLGIPTIGIVTSSNQVVTSDYLRNLGIIKISNIISIRNDILKITFKDRIYMHREGKKLIDGKGVNRIIDNIMYIYTYKKKEGLV